MTHELNEKYISPSHEREHYPPESGLLKSDFLPLSYKEIFKLSMHVQKCKKNKKYSSPCSFNH